MTRTPGEDGRDHTDSVPVDVDLEVERRCRNGEPFLEYVFSSPSGKAHRLFHEELESPVLRRLDGFQEEIYRQLDRLHEGKDADGKPLFAEDVERELSSMGRLLYEKLFPPEMGQAGGVYERFRHLESVRILSEEPWIPWELIKAGDDDCFALRFRLGQWPGASGAASSIRIERLAILEDPEKGLAEADVEAAWLERRAGEVGIGVDRCRCEKLEDLEEFLLAERRQLYHIVGHGQFDAERPDDSVLLHTLPPFRSRHLTGAVARHLAQDRPFIFANACDAGRQGWSLSGPGGWAERWLRCGCSGFLGPRWAVNDASAGEFSKLFYLGLWGALPVGEAVRRARRKLKRRRRGTLDWLAYSLYAHPNARLAFDSL